MATIINATVNTKSMRFILHHLLTFPGDPQWIAATDSNLSYTEGLYMGNKYYA